PNKNSNEKEHESSFEIAGRNLTTSMHNPATPEEAELHSNIPQKILSASYEMGIIAKAASKEQEMFKRYHTIDDITSKENEIFVQIMKEGNEILHRQLPAKDGRSRDDANQNLNSVVAGESARLAAQIPVMEPPLSAVSRFTRWIKGSKN